MSYRLEYIGPTQTFKAAAFNAQDLSLKDILLENGQQYIVELQQEGPITMINGNLIMDPNTTIWVTFLDKYCRIPYSPEAILKQWRIL